MNEIMNAHVPRNTHGKGTSAIKKMTVLKFTKTLRQEEETAYIAMDYDRNPFQWK